MRTTAESSGSSPPPTLASNSAIFTHNLSIDGPVGWVETGLSGPDEAHRCSWWASTGPESPVSTHPTGLSFAPRRRARAVLQHHAEFRQTLANHVGLLEQRFLGRVVLGGDFLGFRAQ